MSRSHEIIIDIKATSEEVFRALTDSEQIVKWFVPGARVDPRVGGEYVKVWGPGLESASTISAWEPGKHFGTYAELPIAGAGEGAVFKLSVDYYIESLDGGITRLRLVQSGFSPDAAWDNEFFEKTKTGWADYLKKLKELLEN